MFVLTLLADTIRIPPHLLSIPTLTSVSSEIEKRYPNKIILDVGLIICPYGPPLEIGDGILVPGDGGAHHQVIFQAVVFRPFVEEVLIGIVKESNESGIIVSVGGFFESVFIPAYWMLNPSTYDEKSGLWVWTPKYDDDVEEEEEGEEDGVKGKKNDDDIKEGATYATLEETIEGTADIDISTEEQQKEDEDEENRFEIEIGSEIRFKVKSVNFTRITTTMKGVQATTTTTSHSSDRAFGLNGGSSTPSGSVSNGGAMTSSPDGGGTTKNGEENDDNGAVRKRSSSADLSDSSSEMHPSPMQIVGSICEDGLGLTSWWNNNAAEEEEGEEEEEEEEEEGENG